LARRSRRPLRQSTHRDGKGSTHIDTAFMGLTSSGVPQSFASSKPEHDPVQSFPRHVIGTADRADADRRSSALHPWSDVLPDGESDGHVGVAEPLRHHLDRLAGGQQQRRLGSPQVVPPDDRQLLLPQRLPGPEAMCEEPVGEPLGVTWGAVRVADQQGAEVRRPSGAVAVRRLRPSPAFAGVRGRGRSGTRRIPYQERAVPLFPVTPTSVSR
jgi:hypothetical protein